MTPSATGIVYSGSPGWIARLRGHLGALLLLQSTDSPSDLKAHLEQRPASLLLLDLQTPAAADQIASIVKTWPQTVVIAFGPAGTDPAIDAEQLGVYAVEDAMVERRRMVSLVQHALNHLALAQENRLLRAETGRLTVLTEASAARSGEDNGLVFNLREFSSALRHFTDVDALVHRLADEVGHSLRVARVGIFCRTRNGAAYRLRAGLRCLDGAAATEYDENHPLLRWLKVQAHAISRANLEHVHEPSTRILLSQTLDQFGAEVLLPLQSHTRLLGWLFVGRLAAGFPFENAHIEHLIAMTDCVSTTLENALLYEEVAIQKTLAETLLHSLPSGIVAVDAEGMVRWYNDSARAMLDIPADAALAHAVEALGSRLADVLRRTLGAGGTEQTIEWTDTATRHSFSVRTQRLADRAQCLGAVAILQDTTVQKALKEQQERLERATFWAELAASMSHEVRNPLVAIKTFAQLLPERYADKEFQTEFRQLVASEVDRLNGIVDQINDFAHPPALELRPLDIRQCVEKSLSTAVPADSIRVTFSAPERLPEVIGDERALNAVFAHLLRNAVEALAQKTSREIAVAIRPQAGATAPPMVEILFKDNGPGIAPALADKIFSPFCTSKARGLGLGLPIAKRTLADHGGQIAVHSNALGTCVSVLLPAAPSNSLFV
jgi:nitrogen-specific signal transduction histidine kinase